MKTKPVFIIFIVLFLIFPNIRVLTADSLNAVSNVIYSTTR
jgi:hypothetical protein